MTNEEMIRICENYLEPMGSGEDVDAFVNRRFVDGVLKLIDENEKFLTCKYIRSGEYSHGSCHNPIVCGEQDD